MKNVFVFSKTQKPLDLLASDISKSPACSSAFLRGAPGGAVMRDANSGQGSRSYAPKLNMSLRGGRAFGHTQAASFGCF